MKFWDMTESSVLEIISGPSKELLSLLLFSRSKLKQPTVHVATAHGEAVKLDIIGIERISRSDEEFNITAYVWRVRGDAGVKVVVYYRTDERKGKIRLYKK